MSRYLLERLGQSLLLLFLISFLVYALIGLMPGDPVDLMISADPDITAEDAARLREIYGLDKPILERYTKWLGGAVQGDFGYSRLYTRPVLDVLWPRLGATLMLLGISLTLSVSLAVPIGIYAARNPYSRWDNLINFLCFGGISIPPFWLALLLIALFAVTFGWLPAGGYGKTVHLILPVLTLTLASIGGYTRYMRSAMMESLRADHIRTARAKGCPERQVIWRHALKNALLPVVTIVALDFGTLFGGALITETMFSWPGMGKLIYDAIMGNDFNMALVALLFTTGMVLIGNFLADLAYAALDPRVSLGKKAAS